MNQRLLILLGTLLTAFFVTSCETSSSGYGYYLGELNDDTILQFFALSDEAANNQDYETYKSFYSPNYTAIDRSQGEYSIVYRQDYLEMVRSIFESAKVVQIDSRIMDIVYSNSRSEATVKVQEEERTIQFGTTKHYTSILDYEISIEDGWIFIEKSVRTSMQVIEE